MVGKDPDEDVAFDMFFNLMKVRPQSERAFEHFKASLGSQECQVEVPDHQFRNIKQQTLRGLIRGLVF